MHYIRRADLARLLSVHPTTIWRWTESGHLPKTTRLGSNTVAWSSETIEQWLATKKKETFL